MNPSLFLHLRLRLSLWFAGAFAVVLIGFGLSTYLLVDHTLMRLADEGNQKNTLNVLHALKVENGRVKLDANFREDASEVRQMHGVVWLELASRRNQALAPWIETVPGGDDRPVRLQYTPIVQHGRSLGTLVVGHGMRYIDRVLSRFRLGLVAAIPLSLLFTCTVGFLLAKMAIRPVLDAFEQQQRFLAEASHELRTPLAIVQAHAEVAIEEPLPLPTNVANAMQAIVRTTRGMGMLVDDLLFLSRADAAALQLVRRRFYLDELAEEVIEDFSVLAGAQSIRIELIKPPHELPIEADPDQLRRLLANLVENALKFAGTYGWVRLTLDDSDRARLVVRVEDSGPGVAPRDVPHVFERFYRSDRSREASLPGTGLGLAIAWAIAQAHGGSLTVYQVPGQGATFDLVLPRSENRAG